MAKPRIREDLQTVLFSFGANNQARVDKIAVRKKTAMTVYLELVYIYPLVVGDGKSRKQS